MMSTPVQRSRRTVPESFPLAPCVEVPWAPVRPTSAAPSTASPPPGAGGPPQTLSSQGHASGAEEYGSMHVEAERRALTERVNWTSPHGET